LDERRSLGALSTRGVVVSGTRARAARSRRSEPPLVRRAGRGLALVHGLQRVGPALDVVVGAERDEVVAVAHLLAAHALVVPAQHVALVGDLALVAGLGVPVLDFDVRRLL